MAGELTGKTRKARRNRSARRKKPQSSINKPGNDSFQPSKRQKEIPSTTQLENPYKITLHRTGVIPVVVLVTSKQQYRKLQMPFPLSAENHAGITDILFPAGFMAFSPPQEVKMWVVACFYNVNDYYNRDLGRQLAKTAQKLMASIKIPSYKYIIYSSTGVLHGIPLSIFKPFPGDEPLYVTYLSIPFGIYGERQAVNTVFQRLKSYYSEEVSQRTNDYLQSLLGVEAFAYMPVEDSLIPEHVDSIALAIQSELGYC
ncbi:MAG: hypothetical protein ACFFD4_32450 [Candidatus Odinarchaeota archaeon]